MKFNAVGHTDIGNTKKSNQDSYCIKIFDTEIGQVALIAVADGMGGLAKGELASAHVIRALSDWFDNDLFDTLQVMENSIEGLESYLTGEWNGFIQKLNLQIMKYGHTNKFNLGTTLTAMLFVGARYSIVHVGDSRVYEISPKKVEQLTSDQTFVNREVKAGRMSPEEAKTHPKRNVLLQCIGSSKFVKPEISHGNIKKNSVYLVCSDGFRHCLTDEDLLRLNTSTDREKTLVELTDYVKLEGESDNITSVVLNIEGNK